MKAGLSELLDAATGVLAEARTRHSVPGAVIALMRGDERGMLSDGLLNVVTGESVTTDSLFQIGSITKVFTATMILQLADRGLLELDDPVAGFGDDLAQVFTGHRSGITLRQLLNHSSGMDGDCFLDTGRDDDCVARLVQAIAGLPQQFPPGQGFSYCNVGYVCAGRVVEHLLGCSWREALADLLLQPLQLEHTAVLPEDAMRYRTAVGHLPDSSAAVVRVARPLLLPRSNEPAGSTTWATAGDLLSFARMHLDGGVGGSGQRLVSAAAIREMRNPEITCPELSPFSAWSHGWALFDRGDYTLFGHDGLTRGQAAFLRIDPDTDLTLVLLANGGDMRGLFETMSDHFLLPPTHSQQTPTGVNRPLQGAVRVSDCCGIYAKWSDALHVTSRGDRLHLRVEPRCDPAGIVRPLEIEMERVSGSAFTGFTGSSRLPLTLTFSRRDGAGKAQEANLNLRSYRRENTGADT